MSSSMCLARCSASLSAGNFPSRMFMGRLHAQRRTRTLQLRCAASLLPDQPTLAASSAISPVPSDLPEVLGDALHRLGAMYVLADASASTAAAAVMPTAVDSAAGAAPQRAGGWVAPVADALEQVLYALQEGLDKLHVPYSYGYSIILLTLIVKLLTYPLTKQQVESAMAVQALKPRIDLIKDRFGEDKDKIQKETSVLYEQAGVNPLAGCLPTLATIPIFIGLFSSLTNVANDGLLDTQGFYFVPSLAGPTTMAMRQSGLGTSWLWPLGPDGAPPIGWEDAAAYLTLPLLLVAVQYASSSVTSPPIDPKDENANTQRALLVFLPLMVGWFSLNVPAGLSLYYLANTVLSSAIQIYLKKLGGANVVMNELGPVTKPGSGRRNGVAAGEWSVWKPATVLTTAEAAKARAEAEEAVERAREAAEEAAAAAAFDNASVSLSVDDSTAAIAGTATMAVTAGATAAAMDPSKVNRRCKRRRLTSLVQDGSTASAAVAGASA
uniref:ALB3p n=2 Tax=Chlamydomonas reinhardtii TaxID=3055 RepID=A8HYK7_CHLRE|nr:ALB3p [Chlamydomonas reinhardtii]|eukprot:XP_001696646.1 inner membrane ALBINO3-like protein 1 [Chlamydomonas reinhardtii]